MLRRCLLAASAAKGDGMRVVKLIAASWLWRYARRAVYCGLWLYLGILLGFVLVVGRSEVASKLGVTRLERLVLQRDTSTRYWYQSYQYSNWTGLRFAEMEWWGYPIVEDGPMSWLERPLVQWGTPQGWQPMLVWVAGWSVAGILVLILLPMPLARRNFGQLQGNQRARMVSWLRATITAQRVWNVRHIALLLVAGLSVAIASEIISIRRAAFSWWAFSGGKGRLQVHEPTNWIGLLTPIDATIVALLAMLLPTLLVLPALRRAARQRAAQEDGWCLRCGYTLASKSAATMKCSECGTDRDQPERPRWHRKYFWPLWVAWLLLTLSAFFFMPLLE